MFSDESAMKLVVPETFQNNTELYEKVVEVSAGGTNTHEHTTHITSISPLAFLLPYTMCTYIPSEHFLILYT